MRDMLICRDGMAEGCCLSAKLGGVMGIVSRYRMSKAAVIVQNLLEMHADSDSMRSEAAAYANRWVWLTYSRKPEMMNGQFGYKPHKLTAAAYALATGINEVNHLKHVQNVAIAGLCTIMSDVTTNGRLYDFNRTDEVLIELANTVLQAVFADAEKPESCIPTKPVELVPNLFRKPQMSFAARGFARGALIRTSGADIDLHEFADSFGRLARNAGSSDLEAYSAQWGGVMSIEADLNQYDAMVQSYVDVMHDEGEPIILDKADDKNMFNVGGSLYLSLVMIDAPNEFERFLRYIGKSGLCMPS